MSGMSAVFLGSDSTPALTIPERVSAVLREGILGGELPPGTPLRHEALSERLGVSFGSLREAIRQLAGEGLVRIEPYHGAVVTSLDTRELRDFVEMATALESIAARSAAPLLTDPDLALAERCLAEIAALAEPRQVDASAVRFREALYAPSGRTALIEAIRSVRLKAARYSRVLYAAPEGRRQAAEALRSIIDGCATRDGALAERAVTRAYAHVHETLARLVAREGSPDAPRRAVPPAAVSSFEALPRALSSSGVGAAGVRRRSNPPRSRRRPSGG